MTIITDVETIEPSSGNVLAIELDVDPPVTSIEMQELGPATTEITFVGLHGPPGTSADIGLVAGLILALS